MRRQNFSNYKMELKRFSVACDKMGEANFITSESRIVELLKSIAESDLLYNFMQELTKDFDFLQAFEKARVPSTLDEYMLMLPTERQEFIAFVFCLILHIDLENIKFSDFLSDYFYDADNGMNGAYLNFCETIVQKFKRSVLSIIDGEIEENQNKESEPKEYKAQSNETESEDVIEGIYEQIKDYAAEIITAAASMKELSMLRKEEIMIVSDSFVTHLESGNKRLVYALFLGLNYTVSNHLEGLDDKLQSIKSILAKNGLI